MKQNTPGHHRYIPCISYTASRGYVSSSQYVEAGCTSRFHTIWNLGEAPPSAKKFVSSIRCEVASLCLFVWILLVQMGQVLRHTVKQSLVQSSQWHPTHPIFFKQSRFNSICIQITVIVNDDQQDATILVYLFIPSQLYMFRAMSSPIIRSTSLYLQTEVCEQYNCKWRPTRCNYIGLFIYS